MRQKLKVHTIVVAFATENNSEGQQYIVLDPFTEMNYVGAFMTFWAALI